MELGRFCHEFPASPEKLSLMPSLLLQGYPLYKYDSTFNPSPVDISPMRCKVYLNSNGGFHGMSKSTFRILLQPHSSCTF